jgi:hypothetical protein
VGEQWVEVIEFTYTNSVGDVVSVSIGREGGIHQSDVRRAFADFLRGVGYSVKEDE